MAERRSEDAVNYVHMGTPCRDSEYQRRCSGRQRIEVSTKTKTDVYQKLKDKRREVACGIRTSGNDTVRSAVDTWPDEAIAGRAAKTVHT